MTKEQHEAWGGAVGGLLLNFGIVEFASYQWIEKLSTDEIVRDVALDLPLSKRIDLIRRLIDRSSLKDEIKKSARALWDEVGKLSVTRNVLAHNPLCFRSVGGNLEAGVINTKQMKGIGPFELSPIMLEDVCRAGSRVAHLLDELGAVFGRAADRIDKNAA